MSRQPDKSPGAPQASQAAQAAQAAQAPQKAKPTFRKIACLERDLAVERRGDGVIVLPSRIPLLALNGTCPRRWRGAPASAPDRPWLAQRGGPDRPWRRLSYAEVKH